MTESEKLYTTFDAMGLKESLLRGIYANGFERPSLIQQKAIMPITTRKDVIAQAQSGTGKTATFCLGVLGLIDQNKNDQKHSLSSFYLSLHLSLHL